MAVREFTPPKDAGPDGEWWAQVVERFATVRGFVRMVCEVIEFGATADAVRVVKTMRALPKLIDAGAPRSVGSDQPISSSPQRPYLLVCGGVANPSRIRPSPIHRPNQPSDTLGGGLEARGRPATSVSHSPVPAENGIRAGHGLLI